MSRGDDPDRPPLPTGGASQPGAAETPDDPKLQLFAEELSVAKETRETARVRVSTVTRETEALVDEDLLHETVEIEKLPIGRRIEAMPEVRREGDTIVVPVVEEVLAIERRLMLKEEIHIRRVRKTERYQERVTLRHQEAAVTRQPAEPHKPDAKSETGEAPPKKET